MDDHLDDSFAFTYVNIYLLYSESKTVIHNSNGYEQLSFHVVSISEKL